MSPQDQDGQLQLDLQQCSYGLLRPDISLLFTPKRLEITVTVNLGNIMLNYLSAAYKDVARSAINPSKSKQTYVASNQGFLDDASCVVICGG